LSFCDPVGGDWPAVVPGECALFGERIGASMDSGKRTVLKAVLWQGLGLGSMALVGFLATGSAALGGGIALANAVIGLVCYVVYERAWARIRWGRHV
jgi:uncharacterized membrane protein